MGQRGPYAKTAAIQDQILTAALDVIAGSGYSNTSLQQIADAVGVTKAGLLHHFGSKNALLTAVLSRRDELGNLRILQGPDAIEGLISLVTHNSEVPGLVSLFAAITGVGASDAPGAPARVFTESHYPGLLELVADAVRRRQSSGLFRQDIDPVAFARVFIATVDGLQTQWLLDPDLDMSDHVGMLLRLAAPAG